MKFKNKTTSYVKQIAASLLLGVSIISPTFAGMPDDPAVTKLMLDKFEVGNVDGENPNSASRGQAV